MITQGVKKGRLRHFSDFSLLKDVVLNAEGMKTFISPTLSPILKAARR
jgi:hypothetical protein